MADANHLGPDVAPQHATEPALHAVVDHLQRLVGRAHGVGIEVEVDAFERVEGLTLPAGLDLLEVGVDAHALQARLAGQDDAGGAARAQHRAAIDGRE